MSIEHKRVWIAILLLFAVIAVISACGSDNKATQPPAGNTTQPPTGNETTPTTTGDPDKGLAVYKGNCLACHGTEGTGGHNGPDLQLSTMSDDPQAIIAKVKAGGGGMPAFQGVLSDDDINNVAAYINQVLAPKQ